MIRNLIGPTGVGKTEIARRLAKLVKAPFIKVEATKFTEVGYVGRDVESIIRDLMENSIRIVKEEKMESTKEEAKINARERIADILIPSKKGKKSDGNSNPFEFLLGFQNTINKDEDEKDEDLSHDRNQIIEQLNIGLLDDIMIEIEVDDTNSVPLEFGYGGGMEEISFNIGDMFNGILPKKRKNKRVPVKDGLKIFEMEEAAALVDMEEVHDEAKKRVEENGIVFIDEIDKIAARGSTHGPDVSREGVQRDILPIVEGSTVNTKYGTVKTDHILFIAAGAFHISKVEDLIPELQGRFPVHVELKSLSQDDFKQILLKPKNALIKQYMELLRTEKVELEFGEDAIEAIAEIAFQMNIQNENIGARRLHTILEQILLDISFEAPNVTGKVLIDKKYVDDKLNSIVKRIDINKYII
jgi:ATP-dependent HslUV protease ATP-binding subunit HslU